MKYTTKDIGQNNMKESICLHITKKPNATRCQGYSTISTMSQVTRLPLKSVMDCMKGKIEAELDDAQSEFHQGNKRMYIESKNDNM